MDRIAAHEGLHQAGLRRGLGSRLLGAFFLLGQCRIPFGALPDLKKYTNGIGRNRHLERRLEGVGQSVSHTWHTVVTHNKKVGTLMGPDQAIYGRGGRI